MSRSDFLLGLNKPAPYWMRTKKEHKVRNRGIPKWYPEQPPEDTVKERRNYDVSGKLSRAITRTKKSVVKKAKSAENYMMRGLGLEDMEDVDK